MIGYKIVLGVFLIKKILFYIPSLEGGGAERELAILLQNINHKYDITLLLTQKTGIFLKDLPKETKIKYLFKKDSKYLIKIYRKLLKFIPSFILYKLFIRDNYDIEIAFLEGEAVKIISGSNINSFKIAWVQTNLLKFHWTKKFFINLESERVAYDNFDKIICCSGEAKSGFEELFRIFNKVEIIYSFVDKEEILLKSNLEDVIFEKFTICSMGRLIEVKGFDRLISVHKKLIDEGYDHNLFIIGEGEKRAELEQQISYLNVSNSVVLAGFKENPFPFIKSCDLFVISSKVEGFPMVGAEALVLEKPILSTNCSGLSEMLDGGKYGILVENSEAGLYNGLKMILNNKELLPKYISLARERKNIFSLEEEINKIENLLQSKSFR